MIKYKLNCSKCNAKNFDSWFLNSKEYEKLKKKNLICCYICGSKNINKSIMAPSVKKRNKQDIDEIISLKRNSHIKSKIYNFQKFIKKNFEDVGKNFPYEARSLHYNNKKNKKGLLVLHQKRILRNLMKRELVPKCFHGLIKIIKFF